MFKGSQRLENLYSGPTEADVVSKELVYVPDLLAQHQYLTYGCDWSDVHIFLAIWCKLWRQRTSIDSCVLC